MSHQSDLISSDIDAYLAQHERKELLRFLTCGNVDDGKSTLIGRLLYDSKMIYEDQLAAVQSDSVKSGTTGAGKIDLALLVDGLQAEREQGITIDVAYRYFSTATRKFIIADTPGHEQYTRNMATGASTCDLAVILIDARYGVQTQTKRHSFIASLLGLKHIIVAINKMDLASYSEETYEKIKADYLDFVGNLDGLNDIHFIPMSALDGDNVVNKSVSMPWYTGKTMMETLETVEISGDENFQDPRFPVQYVNRPNLDFRGFCGTVASGIFHKGDKITVLPSGKTSTIKSIVTFDGELKEAFPPMAITLTLTDEIDISRGDTIVCNDNLPNIADKFDANIVWMAENALTPGKQYILKLATRSVSGSIANIQHRIDVNTLEHHDAKKLQLNEIGLCTVSVNAPVVFDAYKRSKGTGSFIIIDRLTNVTVGAGMITGSSSDIELSHVSAEERAARFGQKAVSIALTGIDKEKIAYQLERKLFDNGHAATVLTSDLTDAIEVVKHAGLICICTISAACDLSFDTDKVSLDEIHLALKDKNIIH
ncbi:MAG: sulfate adenylyltransferase subunit CysN [Methylococcaceae bacterium]|nr:sulfate adenylyltransferase subunit CysN [Methylococcaceae bacterium]